MPVAGEMISLPDHFKKDPQASLEDFRLHYFPDIPVARSSKDDYRSPHVAGFQRTRFENIEMGIDGPDGEQSGEPVKAPVEVQRPSIEEIKKIAYAKGFTEGKKAGLTRSTQKVESVINGLSQVLVELERLPKKIHLEIEKEVALLALAIAKKIVCHEVNITQDTILCVAREALNQLQNPCKIKLKLNPVDLQFIKDNKSQLSRYFDSAGSIRFEADESIRGGGCLIETDMGDIDARLDKQIKAIEDSFKAQFKQLSSDM